MKIAILIDTWFPFVGGGQINVWEISRKLVSRDLQIDVITRNNGKDNLKRIKYLYVHKLGPKSSPSNSFSKILFCWRSLFFILGKDYDLVHAHAFLPGIIARLLMVFKGIPAVFTVHGTSINTKLNNIFSRLLERFILTQILYSAQITVSRDFLKIKNLNKNVDYIPNGVNIKDFDKINTKKFTNPTLIFVGRLHPQKNLLTLILAIEIVNKKIPNINLLIVGSGQMRDEISRLIKLKESQKNIMLVGEKSGVDLIKLYKSSHIFILPSIYEGQPLTILEAWASKIPVIVTKSGDCQYLVKNGFNGYLINNPNDEREIAQIIEKAISAKNLNKLGQNGYNLAKKEFSWKKAAEQTLKLYRTVI